ncbi:hypothetical protein FQN49_006146 [Arthroderma sp. PD_2]|nr:hypothetical protein FQN49_006146 [Arthroderma sp. PD_2]
MEICKSNVWNSPLPSELLEEICSHLGIRDLVALKATSRAFLRIEHFLERKIDRRLDLFVKNPRGFRYLLKEHDAFMAGPFALDFFLHGTQTASQMDVYIRSGPGRVAFSDYLCSLEEYTRVATRSQRADHIQMIEFFSRADSDIIVRLIVTNGMPIKALLHGSYTTACVNFITWNKAYSVFPLLTFVRNEAYLLKEMDDNFGCLLVKYAPLGWTSRNMRWWNVHRGSEAMLRNRAIGGNCSLVVSLGEKGLGTPRTPDFVLEHAQFSLHGSPYSAALRVTAMTELCSPVLRYTYTFTDDSWREFAMKRLYMITVAELYKIEPGDRSTQAVRALNSPLNPSTNSWPPAERAAAIWQLDGFNKPDTWTYADNLIPEWYRAWNPSRKW